MNIFLSIHKADDLIINMKNSNINQDTEELRDRIIDAAENRFLTYGFGKTTMAEIAKDAHMSAANLYRYFQNKHDIAGCCAERCMDDRNEKLRIAVRQAHLSAAEKLLVFATEAFKFNLDMHKDRPKINELVDLISSQQQGLVKAKIAAQVSLIAEILSLGVESGEFEIDDVIATAGTVYISLIVFDVPTFLSLYSKEEFETMAANVVNLLLKGLEKR